MKKILGLVLATILLTVSSFANIFHVHNESTYTIKAVYVSAGNTWGTDLAPEYIYPGEYQAFSFNYPNRKHWIKVETTNGVECYNKEGVYIDSNRDYDFIFHGSWCELFPYN